MKLWSHEIPVKIKRGSFSARLKGLWLWKRIEIGDYFFALPINQQRAVIRHEEGHAMLRHMEQRWKWFFLMCWLRPSWLTARCVAQEFEADAYAAKHGCHDGLVSFLRNQPYDEQGVFHPPISERIERLRRLK